MRTRVLAIAASAVALSCAGQDEVGRSSQEVASKLAFSVVSISAPARVVPGGTAAVTITLRNTGTATWQPSSTSLLADDAAGWSRTTLALAKTTKPSQVGTFTGNLGAPTQIGRYKISWHASSGGQSFGDPIAVSTEVTCSDGVFCNGDERWVNGRCVNGPAPCDDGESCTTDSCDEASARCGHTLGPDCAACFAKNCNPSCKGKVCGDDGCGGSCGVCSPGESCVSGACAVVTSPGSCGAPYALLQVDDQAGEVLLGKHLVYGNNGTGVNETIPTCNPTSPAPELVYAFTVTAADGPVGIDARSFGYDTVLSLRSSCLSDDPAATLACSDDAAPPGDYGSRVATMITAPGTYYLIVDGFDGNSVGDFTLQVTLAANCVPACDGRYCGNTDGCGGDCGLCPTGQQCGAAGRCIPAGECTPDCNGRKCGDDGCGGSCGDCTKGQLCINETGACKTLLACDPDRPVCKVACSSQEYCGTDCLCHRNREARADLVVSAERLKNDILFEDGKTFGDTSCARVEKCINPDVVGPHRLLRFAVEAINQGQATIDVPNPAVRPDLFEFSPCHGHYHFKGFAQYALLDAQGNHVVDGQKLAYCMEDTVQVMQGPQIACDKFFDCENQGIQRGWSDLYGNALDCQWLDITGVPSGSYQLSVTVNPARYFEEGSFDNNTTVVPVTIP